MIKAVILFAIGLVALIKGGDWFVDGAVGIARRFRVPELLIGATVVSIGTTLPEVMVSASSALSGHGEISYGNAIGSVICNTALIAALSIAVKPSSVNKKTLITPVLFFFLSALYYAFNAYFFGYFSRKSGIILLMIFIVYMFKLITDAMTQSKKNRNAQEIEKADSGSGKNILLLVIGAVLIAVGANLLVNNGIIIANEMSVPESVIALTFVALGTSLPELVTAITSLKKGHGLLSVGNIIGANLFNLVLVSGLSVTLAPFGIPNEKKVIGYNASLAVDIPVMFTVMLLFTLVPLIKGKMTRAQGITMLLIYAAFCAFQFSV